MDAAATSTATTTTAPRPRTRVEPPQIDGLQHFLNLLSTQQFSDQQLERLTDCNEFQRIVNALKRCENNANTKTTTTTTKKNDDDASSTSRSRGQSLNYTCIARTLCPSASRAFFQCFRMAQSDNRLTCTTQRRVVELCVGEHVSQSMYHSSAGSTGYGDIANEDGW
jgi:hypothetical protein